MALPSLQAIQERKVVQWGLAYLAGAWLVLQVVVALGSVYGWPLWLLRAIPVLLVAGLFVAVVLAWFHGEKGHQRITGVELGLLAVVLGLAGVGVAVFAPSGEASPAETEHLSDADLEDLGDKQALELAYEWGLGGNMTASMSVLDRLIGRAESDSAKMAYLATGASLLSKDGRRDEAVAWMLRIMDIDPVSLTLTSDAGSEITDGYLEAMRRHYATNTRPSPVSSVAVLPQGAYMVGFPDSLSESRTSLADGIPSILEIELADALASMGISVLARGNLDTLELGPLPIQEVSVGLPGSDWLWVDERSMPIGWMRASHYVLCYCTYLGDPFERGGVGSMTCSARLISTEGSGVQASAQSPGDLKNWSDIVSNLSSSLVSQLSK